MPIPHSSTAFLIYLFDYKLINEYDHDYFWLRSFSDWAGTAFYLMLRNNWVQK